MKKTTCTLHLERRQKDGTWKLEPVDVGGYLHANSGLFIHRTVDGAGGLQSLAWTVTHPGTSKRVRQTSKRAEAVTVCAVVAGALEIAGFAPRAWAAAADPFGEFKGSLEASAGALRELTNAGTCRNA